MTEREEYGGTVVVFDLDDTLFPEREWAVGAYRLVASQSQFAGHSAAIEKLMSYALTHRENPFDRLEAYMAANSLSYPGSIPALVALYRSWQPEKLTPWPDALEILCELESRGIPRALITDGRSLTQRAKLRALGVSGFFLPEDILISGETGARKTESGNFAAVENRYPCAARYMYIGDNPARDFTVPRSRGWECLCLRARKGNIHAQPQTDVPLISSLNELKLRL